MMDSDDCGAINGMNEWQGKRKYLDKTCPMPLCQPQIAHDVTWDQTQEVGD
jgi:hypothetical protein